MITASLMQASDCYSTAKMTISYFSLDAAALDFQLNRCNMYTMAHTFKDYKFLARVVRSKSTYLLQRKADGHLKFITMAIKPQPL